MRAKDLEDVKELLHYYRTEKFPFDFSAVTENLDYTYSTHPPREYVGSINQWMDFSKCYLTSRTQTKISLQSIISFILPTISSLFDF
jgi:hypothetical protein